MYSYDQRRRYTVVIVVLLTFLLYKLGYNNIASLVWRSDLAVF